MNAMEMPLGPLMVGLPSTELTQRDRELLLHPNVGGVILFDRNYHDHEQLGELNRAIHALRRPHLLIAVDHEGGRVQRFLNGFSRIPPMRSLGDLYDNDSAQALKLAETIGWLTATELGAAGVDLNFSPVLDLDHGCCEVIGNRALHSDFQVVAELGRAQMRGMKQAGMQAVGKHFPGHGAVKRDTHHEIVTDPRPWADIETQDMAVFERMIHYGLPAIMMSHVIYLDVDPEPASLSKRWIDQILWHTLGFEGAIFSDDMFMQGVADLVTDIAQCCIQALEAGSDMVLLCNDPSRIERCVEQLAFRTRPSSLIRLSRLHGSPAYRDQSFKRDERWRQAQVQLKQFNGEPQLPF